MTNSIYRLFFIMMVFMMAPSTQANDIYITQVGDNLDLDIVQDGTDNEVGDSTTATVINGDNMAFDITQQGNYNFCRGRSSKLGAENSRLDDGDQIEPW